jgi:hypothetical protein
LAIILIVQSPALLTTREKPVFPGSGIVAKLCHSVKGESERRTKLPAPGVARGIVSLVGGQEKVKKCYTVIKVHADGMVRELFTANRHLLQSNPGQDE